MRAKDGRGNLFVDVNPNLTKTRHWRFRVQVMKNNGAWRTLTTTFKTRGKKQTRTLDLDQGIYRVVVKPRNGYAGVTSDAVHLKR